MPRTGVRIAVTETEHQVQSGNVDSNSLEELQKCLANRAAFQVFNLNDIIISCFPNLSSG